MEKMFPILQLEVGKQLQTAVQTQTTDCKSLADLKRLPVSEYVRLMLQNWDNKQDSGQVTPK